MARMLFAKQFCTKKRLFVSAKRWLYIYIYIYIYVYIYIYINIYIYIYIHIYIYIYIYIVFLLALVKACWFLLQCSCHMLGHLMLISSLFSFGREEGICLRWHFVKLLCVLITMMSSYGSCSVHYYVAPCVSGCLVSILVWKFFSVTFSPVRNVFIRILSHYRSKGSL